MRGAFGFPVHPELAKTLAQYMERQGKMVFEISKHLVVKIVCVKQAADGTPQICGFFNGFFYHDTDPLIITVGRIKGFAGATRYCAMFPDGTQHELTIKKSGLPKEECFNSVHICFWPDVTIMECDQQPAHPPRPYASVASVNETVFVTGFKRADDAQLVLSQATVSYDGMDGMTITGYTDIGFPGSPVFSANAAVVGMVIGGEGSSINQVKMVPATSIHQLLQSGVEPGPLPGFKG